MQETGRSLLTINDGGCIPKATKRFAIMKHRLFMLTLTYRNGIIHKKAIGWIDKRSQRNRQQITQKSPRSFKLRRIRRRRYHRGWTFLHHRDCRSQLHRCGYHPLFYHRSFGLLLCGIMLCGICLNDSGSRKCLYLFLCNHGRIDCLDYRLGFGIGVLRGSYDRQHQLEPLFDSLFGRLRDWVAASLDCLSVGWRDCEHSSFPDCRHHESFPDTGNGRQFHIQWNHCIPESGCCPDFRHFRMEIYPCGELHSLPSCQYRHIRRIWLFRNIERCRHCILCLSRFRCSQHCRTRDKEPQTGYADWNLDVACRLYCPLYPLRTCHDWCCTLFRLWRA